MQKSSSSRVAYDVKLPNSTSCGERGYVTKGFCFSFPNLDAVLENLTPGKFVNGWKTEEMKWKLEVRNSANSLSSMAFSLPRPGLKSGWRSSHFLEACSRLQDSRAEQDREKVGDNCVGAGERPSDSVVLSSFSLLSSRHFSIVFFITARSPFFACLHRPRACHTLTY